MNVLAPMTLYQGDALEVLPTLPDNSVDLIVTDPPYFRVKDEWWDRQWDTAAGFVEWIGKLCEQWQRVLKPNGSLYVFASPKMAARVECKIGESFNVLNQIRWEKPSDNSDRRHVAQVVDAGLARTFYPSGERIVFAEHFSADNMAKGEAGYEAKCDELRGFVFEPLRAYLDSERERSGVSVRKVAEAFQQKSGSRTVTGMAGHWFGRVQWALPTLENYEWLRVTLAGLNHNGEYLRRDYEDLRRDYEDLRRPFGVTAEVPYTDVWDFPTVNTYPGKHPCEKPLEMMEHIIRTSSREGATVLDCFVGSGAAGEAAVNLNRSFIGIEIDERWCRKAKQRIEARSELLISA